MFSVRQLPSRLSRSLLYATRTNSTVATASQASQAPPTPVTESGKAEDEPHKTAGRRKRKTPPKRPNISRETPRAWNRALGEGVVPAYDFALQYLHRDSKLLKAEEAELRAQIAVKEGEYQVLQAEVDTLPEEENAARQAELENLDEEVEKLMKKAEIVEVQSGVNLPGVRWTVNNAMADMSNASHRHLVEQKWRKDGDLDLLMERLHQMHTVPDVLPEIHPSIDLHVIARTRPTVFIESRKVQEHVIPGTFLRPKQTLVPPKLRVNVFHTDLRLYTMLLVDLDVPHPGSERYTTFLHWLKPNIPLSATSSNHLANLNTHTTYIPPHPQRGTPYHRYVTLLLPQPPISKYSLTTAARASGPTSKHLDIPIVSDEERHGFDVRAFVSQWDLDAGRGGGAHIWREVWDGDVSAIYKDILKIPEPRYGRPPKVNVYAELKQRKKYTL